MMYFFTTVPHAHGNWQLQELLGNHLAELSAPLYGLVTVSYIYSCLTGQCNSTTVGPLNIESLLVKKLVSPGTLGVSDDPLVVQTKI